jgi:hypothetical protein
MKNNFFISCAKLRNNFLFYGFPFEKTLYKKFLTGFYRRRQSLEKSGSYPLSYSLQAGKKL